MKNLLKASLVIGVGSLVLMGCAPKPASEIHYLSIQDVYNSPEAQQKLDPSIKFHFGKSVAGEIVRIDTINRKVKMRDGDKTKACQKAMFLAMLKLQKQAKNLGVTKISNVMSLYKKKPYVSTTQYQCNVSSIAWVVLKGDFVK